MTYAQLIYSVRRYAQLAQAHRIDFGTQVDHLVALFKDAEVARGVDGGPTATSIDATVLREYPAFLRNLPPAKTPDKG